MSDNAWERPGQGQASWQSWTDVAWNRYMVLAVLVFAWACGGNGCDGCDDGCDDLFNCDGDGEVTPPAYTYPTEGPRMARGAQVHLTERGMRFVGENLTPLLGDLLGDDGLGFCLEPQSFSVGIGNAEICGGGRVCDDGTPGCQLELEIAGFDLVPVPAAFPQPTRLRANVRLNITRGIQVSVLGSNCQITGENLPVSAVVDFRVDPTAVNDPTSGKVRVGVPTDQLDFDIQGLRVSGGGLCSLLGSLLPVLGGTLTDQLTGPIEDLLGTAVCERCSDAVPCPPGNTCIEGVCMVNGQDRCLGIDLGLDGLLDVGSFLSDFAPGLQAELAYTFWLADYADAINAGPGYGLDLGARPGFTTPDPSLCVPFRDPPTANLAKSRDLHQALSPAPFSNPFAVGIGLARPAIDLALWAAYQSGVLCLSIGADQVEQLNTGLFRILLPSLPDLTGPGSRPVLLQLRPNNAPYATLGQNRIRPDGTLEDPLVTINIEDLDIDFYTLIYDRTTRIFTLNTDVRLGVGIEPVPAGLQIVLGDITQAFTRVEPRNANLLNPSDVNNVANLLPTLLNIVVPELASALADPIELPEFAGFRLVLREGSITGVDEGEFLAIFADLGLANAQPMRVAPVEPLLLDVAVEHTSPERARESLELARRGQVDLLALAPRVQVAVGSRVLGRPLAVSYRVNGGLWSRFHEGARLDIHTELLAFDGRHTVELRVREPGLPETTSVETLRFEVVTDHTPPSVSARIEGDLLLIEAQDAVTHAEELMIEVQVDGGAWQRLAPGQRSLSLAGQRWERHPAALVVRATDEQGHVGETRVWKHSAPGQSTTSRERNTGCAATGAAPGSSPLWLLGLAALVALRRRWALLLAVSALAFLGACGDDSPAPSRQGCDVDDACADGQICLQGLCVDGLRCADDDACPDGQRCVAGVCAPEGPVEGCESPADCTTACSGDQVPLCVDRQCVCEAPCPAGCSAGSYCCASSRTCEPLPPGACADLDCPPGTQATVQTESSINQATCTVVPGSCTCERLPPLPLGVFGHFTDAATAQGGALRALSTYNATYGDLMVGVQRDGGDWTWHFVDGLPEESNLTGDPDGPRGGVAAPGDDVGRHTSIAIAADGTLHVAYQTVTGATPRALRYARGVQTNGGWDWTFVTVDTDDFAGAATSIVLAEGVPHIVYAAPRRYDAASSTWHGDLRWAAASSATPTSAGDFEVRTVASHIIDAPCAGFCASGSSCRSADNACVPTEPARRCSPQCGGGQACFADGADFVCAAVAALPALEGIRPSIGLHVRTLLHQGSLIAYHYDSERGNLLRTAVDVGDFSAETLVVDGEEDDGQGGRVSLGDIGRFPAPWISAEGRELVAYLDATLGELRVADVSAGVVTVVDDGARATAQSLAFHRVGADPTLVRDGAGVGVIYQDATAHTVSYSRETAPGVWTDPQVLVPGEAASTEALGFFLRVTQDPRGVQGVTHRIDRRSTPPRRDIRSFPITLGQ